MILLKDSAWFAVKRGMSAKRLASGGWLVCVFSVTMLAAAASPSGVRHASTCLADGFSTASGHGLFVRVGAFSNTVLLSTDGTHWACQNSGTPSSLYSIAFGNDRFVAVGNEGAIVISADGVAWKLLKSGTEERLRSIIFARKMFVAVGYNGLVLTSRDGLGWKSRNSGTDDRLHGVVFGNDRFIAISKKGQILESRDGSKWTRLTALAGTFKGIAYANGRFTADSLEGVAFTSPDGVGWAANFPMIASSDDRRDPRSR
jgi:hypothetical protein